MFPDRNFAVSGDTVWFVVSVHSNVSEGVSEVVHVQLDNLTSQHITKASVQCNGGTGKGYIYIPDSLSTGVYILRPFSLIQKNSGKGVAHQKLLTVYNRFDEDISWIEQPEIAGFKDYAVNSEIDVKTGKKQFLKREAVNVTIDIPAEEVEKYDLAFITAGVANPSADEYSNGAIPFMKNSAANPAVNLVEKNGVLVTGKVFSKKASQPVSNAIVLLSIPDTIPYFDYYLSDSAGAFYFYLRNATGNADLVIQALSHESTSLEIDVFENFIDAGGVESARKIMMPEETEFADNMIEAAYYRKLFGGYQRKSSGNFKMPMQFEYPFYGKPTNTFDPDLFIDLPDFQEIAREILSGVQYRERKNDTTIRLMNHGNKTVFNGPPLMLLDGIPVFDISVFTPMGTNIIDEVDVVNYKRFFGDLSFNGVMSVYTKQQSLNWVDSRSEITHVNYSCLQPQTEFHFRNKKVENTAIPNLNKVLYRNTLTDLDSQINFDFVTSDIRGKIEINVLLVDEKNRISFVQEFIEVK